MTFDEEIAQAFETLTGRVRGEVDRQVRRVTEELVADARRQARDEGSPKPPPPDTASGERLAEGMRAVGDARSLTGVLDALVAGVRAESGDAGVWLVRGARLHQWRSSEDADDGLPDLPYLEGEHEDGVLALPIAIAGQTVAVLRTELGTENLELRRQRVEVLARYAARCLESLTAFKTARALTQPAHAAAPPAPGDEAGAAENESALRYARLLVSEIKLYHESAVIEGRRDRDLATRLGGEIARARAMYEQRVPPDVGQRADHFHNELVRTLANGDSSLLEVRTQN